MLFDDYCCRKKCVHKWLVCLLFLTSFIFVKALSGTTYCWPKKPLLCNVRLTSGRGKRRQRCSVADQIWKCFSLTFTIFTVAGYPERRRFIWAFFLSDLRVISVRHICQLGTMVCFLRRSASQTDWERYVCWWCRKVWQYMSLQCERSHISY